MGIPKSDLLGVTVALIHMKVPFILQISHIIHISVFINEILRKCKFPGQSYELLTNWTNFYNFYRFPFMK